MIKTIVVGGIIISFFAAIIGYSDIFTIMLRFKGDMIIIFSYFFSWLTVFSIGVFLAYEAFIKLFRHL